MLASFPITDDRFDGLYDIWCVTKEEKKKEKRKKKNEK